MSSLVSVFSNPALPRAIVVGLFGGAGLALTSIYSRRGPLIYPVYAAILAALALPIELPLNYFRYRIGFQGHLKVKTIKAVLQIEMFSPRKAEARGHVESQVPAFHLRSRTDTNVL